MKKTHLFTEIKHPNLSHFLTSKTVFQETLFNLLKLHYCETNYIPFEDKLSLFGKISNNIKNTNTPVNKLIHQAYFDINSNGKTGEDAEQQPCSLVFYNLEKKNKGDYVNILFVYNKAFKGFNDTKLYETETFDDDVTEAKSKQTKNSVDFNDIAEHSISLELCEFMEIIKKLLKPTKYTLKYNLFTSYSNLDELFQFSTLILNTYFMNGVIIEDEELIPYNK